MSFINTSPELYTWNVRCVVTRYTGNCLLNASYACHDYAHRNDYNSLYEAKMTLSIYLFNDIRLMVSTFSNRLNGNQNHKWRAYNSTYTQYKYVTINDLNNKNKNRYRFYWLFLFFPWRIVALFVFIFVEKSRRNQRGTTVPNCAF